MSNYKELNSERLKFEEEEHTYTDTQTGLKLTSVTTLIGSLFPAFDAKGLAKTIADGFKQRNGAKFKQGQPITDLDRKKATQKYWLQVWKEKAEYGTFVHNQIEEYCKVPVDLSEHTLMTKQAIRYLDNRNLNTIRDLLDDDIANCGYEIYPEAKIFSEKWGLAGTIDLLAFKNDGTVLIGDWKTNNKFTTKAYNKEERGIKPSTRHLSNSKINTYGLQLMIYTYILKTEYNIEPTVLEIVHLDDKNYTVYRVDYNEALVESILMEKIKDENLNKS
jgi:ATP-dependent exoDNAse (exonuclease V) beta subunit